MRGNNPSSGATAEAWLRRSQERRPKAAYATFSRKGRRKKVRAYFAFLAFAFFALAFFTSFSFAFSTFAGIGVLAARRIERA